MTKLTLISFLFSSISIAVFLLLRGTQYTPTAILSLAGALVFFAMAVMNVIETVHKRNIGQLKQPVQLGSIAFAVTGVTGAGRSAYLGMLTGAWEYWAQMINMIFFVIGVLLLWHNRFFEKLLQDVKEK